MISKARSMEEVMSFLSWEGLATSGEHVASSEADHADWAKAKISAAMAGLRDGSNRVFSAAEWAAIRAEKKASREVHLN
ncbi:hypothetical protein [Duganella vulcania]|uniref:Uncharacterized protein n=1 Tax=Duganella vulcania TaxID=2692166 RepID=A0A845GKW1_9BURK|nr:hypothetical protein [Duganella vulcania]MYM93377.1 hypothetical protein [Duganella vulcania]